MEWYFNLFDGGEQDTSIVVGPCKDDLGKWFVKYLNVTEEKEDE